MTFLGVSASECFSAFFCTGYVDETDKLLPICRYQLVNFFWGQSVVIQYYSLFLEKLINFVN